MELLPRLKANLTRVQDQIREACHQAGRSSDSVKLVAVTKYVSAEVIRALVSAGATDLGENRPQALEEKANLLADPGLHWHLIGHLQRNKIRKVLPLVHLIHSGDSLRLLTAIHSVAAELNLKVDILLEVNISREPAKQGFLPEEVREVVPSLSQLSSIRVRGLMGMSGLESNARQRQTEFASLRILLEHIRAEYPETRHWSELSMGMSDDFPAAIAEGSTLVRVGSALFEGLL